MRYSFIHEKTGDIVEIPPPNPYTGKSVVRFNGRVVENIQYCDDEGGYVVADDGRRFDGDEWPKYIAKQLENGVWRVIN